MTIFVRSCYRVAELRGGFGGHLANDETTYVILESTMIAMAGLSLTVVHPVFIFGDYWKLKLAMDVFTSAPTETVQETGVKHAFH